MIGDTKNSFRSHSLLFVYLFDVFLAGFFQATLTFRLAAATALLGVFLTVCKIVVSHFKNYELY